MTVDILCVRLARRLWWSFLGLQIAEVWALCGASALVLSLLGLPEPRYEFAGLMRDLAAGPKTYAILATYTVSLGLGGTLVRMVTGLLRGADKQRPGIDGAGSIIGVLERLLVTSFVLFWPSYGAAAIGLIFSAKSIARFPEMGKQDGTHFAEVPTSSARSPASRLPSARA